MRRRAGWAPGRKRDVAAVQAVIGCGAVAAPVEPQNAAVVYPGFGDAQGFGRVMPTGVSATSDDLVLLDRARLASFALFALLHDHDAFAQHCPRIFTGSSQSREFTLASSRATELRSTIQRAHAPTISPSQPDHVRPGQHEALQGMRCVHRGVSTPRHRTRCVPLAPPRSCRSCRRLSGVSEVRANMP